jgi:hypothetical protein
MRETDDAALDGFFAYCYPIARFTVERRFLGTMTGG